MPKSIIKQTKNKTIKYYWEQFLKKASPLVLDWLAKETDFLKKNIKNDSVIL